MGEEIRVYAVLSAPVAAIPSLGEWKAMLSFANTQGLLGVNAVAVASQNFIAYGKVSQGDPVGKHAIVSYEVAPDETGRLITDADSALKVRMTALGIGNGKTDDQRIAAVLQKSAQALLSTHPEVVALLRWDNAKAAAFVAGLTVAVVGYGDQDAAIAQVQRYLQDNADAWYAKVPEIG